jgi:hypothetical protein
MRKLGIDAQRADGAAGGRGRNYTGRWEAWYGRADRTPDSSPVLPLPGCGRRARIRESGNERQDEDTNESLTCRKAGARAIFDGGVLDSWPLGALVRSGSAEVSSLFRSSASLNESRGIHWPQVRASEGRFSSGRPPRLQLAVSCVRRAFAYCFWRGDARCRQGGYPGYGVHNRLMRL